jgi:hypothetical protein
MIPRMRGNTWSRRAAGVVTPLACFVVVVVGYWVHQQHEAEPPAEQVVLVQARMVPALPPVPDLPATEERVAVNEPPSLGPISKMAVMRGMNAVKPAVARCYERYQIPGMAMVNVVIGRDGIVKRAVVSGRFEETPTGACVEAAVKTATFPPSDGLSTPYPFMLE